MTRNIFLIILIGFMMSCQNRNTDNKNQAPAAPDLSKLEIVIIDVKGMTCTGCEETITKNVTSLDGINACKVSHIEGKARVEFDSTLTTISKISDAIKKSGYQVEDVYLPDDTTGIAN